MPAAAANARVMRSHAIAAACPVRCWIASTCTWRCRACHLRNCARMHRLASAAPSCVPGWKRRATSPLRVVAWQTRAWTTPARSRRAGTHQRTRHCWRRRSTRCSCQRVRFNACCGWQGPPPPWPEWSTSAPRISLRPWVTANRTDRRQPGETGGSTAGAVPTGAIAAVCTLQHPARVVAQFFALGHGHADLGLAVAAGLADVLAHHLLALGVGDRRVALLQQVERLDLAVVVQVQHVVLALDQCQQPRLALDQFPTLDVAEDLEQAFARLGVGEIFGLLRADFRQVLAGSFRIGAKAGDEAEAKHGRRESSDGSHDINPCNSQFGNRTY